MNATRSQDQATTVFQALVKDTVIRVELVLAAIGLIALTFMYTPSSTSKMSEGPRDNAVLREQIRDIMQP